MRQVRLSVAMSLDGFIAGPNGEFDWIPMDPDIDFGALTSRFDVVLMGRKSYESAKKLGGGLPPGLQAYVFSRTLRQADCPDATVSNSAEEILATLRKKAGKDLWLFGGASLFTSFLESNLVDSIEIAVVPIILGGGIPLFPNQGVRSRLKLVNQRTYPKTGTVLLEYEVKHSGKKRAAT